MSMKTQLSTEQIVPDRLIQTSLASTHQPKTNDKKKREKEPGAAGDYFRIFQNAVKIGIVLTHACVSKRAHTEGEIAPEIAWDNFVRQ